MLLPGEDLPRILTTDYLVSQGEEIEIDGRSWLVDRVDLTDRNDIDEAADAAAGVVTVVPPRGPTS